MWFGHYQHFHFFHFFPLVNFVIFFAISNLRYPIYTQLLPSSCTCDCNSSCNFIFKYISGFKKLTDNELHKMES